MGHLVDRVFEHGIQAQRVDLAKGIVYGAKIAGMKSLHGRDYTDRAYQNSVSQYEGAVGYLNHAGGSSGRRRDVADAFCVYHNPTVIPGDGVRADIHVLDAEEPFARKFLKAAASDDPAKHRAFSFSHDAQISTSKNDRTGRAAVESIEKVLSVDVVARGATTKGIFEGYDMIPGDPDEGAAKDEDGMCQGKPYHHHVANAMHAVATHPTMSPDQKKAKTGHLMKALHGAGMDEGLDGAAKEEPGEISDEEHGGRKSAPADKGEIEPAPTSKGGSFKEGVEMTELEELRLRERVRKAADGFGVAVDDDFLTQAVQEGFDGALVQLAERQKRQRARESARPRSVSRQQFQTQEADGETPRTTQDFLARIAPGTQGRVAR